MSTRRLTGLVIAGLLVLAVATRLALIRSAEIEVDEFQHLHSAWLTSAGQKPYVDFFEHHPPLFYYLGAALIDPRTADFETLIHFRWLALACHIGAVGLATALALRLGTAEGVAALAFLLAEIFSFAWGSTMMLDSLAAPLLVLSVLWLARRPGASSSYFFAGVLVGTAILFTNKAIFAAPAPAAFALVWGSGRERRAGTVAARLLLLLAGAFVPLAGVAWLLGTDGIQGMWQDVVAINAGWKARHWPRAEAFVAAGHAGTIWFLAGAGLLAGLMALRRRAASLRPEALLPLLYLATLSAGTILLPVVWYEYFIEFGVFAALVGAYAAVDLARIAGLLPGEASILPHSKAALRACGWGLALVSILGLALRAVEGPFCPRLSIAGYAVTLAAGTLLLLAALRARRLGEGHRAALASLLALVALPLVNQVEWLRRGGIGVQREAVEFVQSHTTLEDTVFDGYTGYGVFRPHAYRYWFLHEEVVPMLSREERGVRIVEALERPNVRLAIRDKFTRLLEPEVNRYLDDQFAPAWRSLIWIRRDSAAR